MDKRIRILIVEDSEDDTVLLLRELERGGYDATHRRVETAKQMREALEQETWDAVLSDYFMPDFNAPEALDVLRESGLDLPFIIQSGSVGEDIAVQAMRAGAHDYFRKEHLDRLVPAIERELRNAQTRRERRETEDELARQHELLDRVMETSPIGITVTDHEGRITSANARAEQILGLSKAEITQRTYDEPAWHATDYEGNPLPPERQPFQLAIDAGGPVFGIELAIERPSGRRVLLSVNASTLPNAHAKVPGVVATIEDVTERIGAERELERLASFPKFNPNPVIETSTDGTVTYLNPAARKAFPDLEPAGANHPVIADVIKPTAPLERRVKLAEKEISVGDTVYHRTVWHAPDGEGLRLYLVDITERKHTEDQLRESEERYRRLVEASPDAIGIIAGGKVVYANASVVDLVGATSPDELIGLDIMDFVPRDLRELFRKQSERVMRTLRSAILAEGKMVRLDGSLVDIEATIIPFMHQGRPALQVVIHDVTEQRQIDQVKSDFIAAVSHELRTPLAVISGFADVLSRSVAKGIDEALCARATRTIHDRSVYMTQLIESLLDMSQIQSGAFRLSYETVDPTQLVATVAALAPLTEHHSLGLDIAPELPQVACDPNRLSTALTSLLSNAVKFSPQGGAIEVRVRQDADRLRISVQDDGVGIARADLKKVFEPFTQSDMTSTRRFAGAGVGLYLVRQIAEAHGGHVSVESELGKGSTFTIEIPVKETKAAAGRKSAAA